MRQPSPEARFVPNGWVGGFQTPTPVRLSEAEGCITSLRSVEGLDFAEPNG
ncbi:MAG: hypothetical protein QM605_12295 [Sphingobium sp.]